MVSLVAVDFNGTIEIEFLSEKNITCSIEISSRKC